MRYWFYKIFFTISHLRSKHYGLKKNYKKQLQNYNCYLLLFPLLFLFDVSVEASWSPIVLPELSDDMDVLRLSGRFGIWRRRDSRLRGGDEDFLGGDFWGDALSPMQNSRKKRKIDPTYHTKFKLLIVPKIRPIDFNYLEDWRYINAIKTQKPSTFSAKDVTFRIKHWSYNLLYLIILYYTLTNVHWHQMFTVLTMKQRNQVEQDFSQKYSNRK